MESPSEKYLREHSTRMGEVLDWVTKQTHLRTNYPQMLSGPVQGRLLTMLVQISGARRILEIGTFSGYSTICLAYGLPQGGHIDTLEINDEMEALIREGFARSGMEDRITLTIGDALESMKNLSGEYDLAYIDADKRQYCEYYEPVLSLLRPGGLLIVDDVLWNGKLFEEEVPGDKQTQSIARFNELVASDPRVEVVILPLRDGMSLIRKK